MMDLQKMASQAKSAAKTLAVMGAEEKKIILKELAQAILSDQENILAANRLDVQNAEKSGLSASMIDRLLLDPSRLKSITDDLLDVANLPDPIGEVIEKRTLTNGLNVRKIRVPLGVLAVIYEARPNVTVDVAGLAIKSGSGVILRGGSETLSTNKAMLVAIRNGLRRTPLSPEIIQFIDDPDRKIVLDLMKMYDKIDMLIPRGGAGLHTFCRENSMIPVITGGIGICHLFVDETADQARSVEVIRNAKIQRPSVCNALDTVLVHKNIMNSFLPVLVAELEQNQVTFKADEPAYRILHHYNSVSPATSGDFDTEWLSLVLGIKIVQGMDEAIEHISAHSTGHSDGILTGNELNAQRFIQTVDSAVVYVNASTRFTDGAQLGLGAEIAVSTQRLHARGPMGLAELTTYKWLVEGDYQTRG